MGLVSFVVPTLKEDEIGGFLARVSEHFSAIAGHDFELILADDSPAPYKQSMDEAIALHRARFAPRVVAARVDGPHRGKGAAVRAGVLASRGEVVFTMDADVPVPLENVERFLRLIEGGDDVIVAERPFDRNLSQPVRFVASRVLLALQRVVVFQSRMFDDTQCGFKAFRRELVRRIARAQIVDGGMVDIEYLYAATREGAKIACVNVVTNPETRASRINVKKAIWQDPVDLLRIKARGLMGGYRR